MHGGEEQKECFQLSQDTGKVGKGMAWDYQAYFRRSLFSLNHFVAFMLEI